MRAIIVVMLALVSVSAFAKWDDRFAGTWVLIDHSDPGHDGKHVNDTFYDKATAVRSGSSIRYRQKNHYMAGQWMTSVTEKVIDCDKLGEMWLSYDLVPDGADVPWLKPDTKPREFVTYDPASVGGQTIATVCRYVR